MAQKIKIGAVSYLNTKPLIYGFEQGLMKDSIELMINYPSKIASLLKEGKIDIGLVPVAAIPEMKEKYIISDYCIGCDGEVVSVCLFSDVPLKNIETIVLDYQSRTSVELLKIVLKEHWNISPKLLAGTEDFEKHIAGTTAGLIIGDRALKQRNVSEFVFDLGLAWKELTGLPFVFAAWVSNKELPEDFIKAFNAANEFGLNRLEEVISRINYDSFDLKQYYTQFVKFKLDSQMQAAKALFLRKIIK